MNGTAVMKAESCWNADAMPARAISAVRRLTLLCCLLSLAASTPKRSLATGWRRTPSAGCAISPLLRTTGASWRTGARRTGAGAEVAAAGAGDPNRPLPGSDPVEGGLTGLFLRARFWVGTMLFCALWMAWMREHGIRHGQASRRSPVRLTLPTQFTSFGSYCPKHSRSAGVVVREVLEP